MEQPSLVFDYPRRFGVEIEINAFDGDYCPNKSTVENKLIIAATGIIYSQAGGWINMAEPAEPRVGRAASPNRPGIFIKEYLCTSKYGHSVNRYQIVVAISQRQRPNSAASRSPMA